MNKGMFWKFFSIAGIALSLLLTVGFILVQAASPGEQSTLSKTREVVVVENNENSVKAGDSMAPAARLDDGFWYQGRLSDGNGNPLPNTNINVIFRIYDSTLNTATALDEVTVDVNTDENGLFNEEIDFNYASLFNGQALYLGLHVAGEVSEMTPRQYLRPVPYALSIRPGAVIAGSITLGNLGTNGYFYVHDVDDSQVLRFSGSTGYLRVGGEGEDGDLFITNTTLSTTFQVDGMRGHVYVYDGEGNTAENRLFEFDSTFESVESGSLGAIWGNQTGTLGNLSLASNDDVDVYLEQTNPDSTIGQFRIYNGAGVKVYQIAEDGDTWSAGTKAALVDTEEHSKRLLYAMESPEVWFEDFGTAQLVNGQFTVNIEPLFLQTINTEVSYHVFVTPLGDCNGLYVTNKTASSFGVRELGGGTANIGFDYRIVAKRLGYEDLRLDPPDPTGVEIPGPGGRPNASVPEDEFESLVSQK
jgi:hypothetical protein